MTIYIYIKKNENAILLIAGGDDGHEKELKSLVIKLNLENSVFPSFSVHFKGSVLMEMFIVTVISFYAFIK